MPSNDETSAAAPHPATPPALPAPGAAPATLGDCGNCGTPLLGGHCYVCGQPVKGLVRHFSSLMGDVLDSVFEWDARVPRTLGPLFRRPGHLSLEYFSGRRIRYVSPFRLFFFLAVISVVVAKFTISWGDDGGIVNFGGDSAIETARSAAEVEAARDEALAELADARKRAGDAPGAGAGITAGEIAVRAQADERLAAFREAERTGGPPPVPRPHRLSFGDTPWDREANPIRIDGLPQFANDWLNRQAGRTEKNIQRLQEDPDQFKDALIGAIPSTLFVLLPLFALMLKFAYLFERRLYMEHLIVALHSHAFLCLALLLMFVTMALQQWLAPQPGALQTVFRLIEAALWTWMPIYLLLMQKRVYRQGWPMTLLKYSVIGFCYMMLLSFGAAFMTVASLVWM